MLKLEDVEQDTRRELEFYLSQNYSLDPNTVHGIEVEDGELIAHFDNGDANVKIMPLTTPLPPRTFALLFPDTTDGGN